MGGDGEIRDCISHMVSIIVRDVYEKDSGVLRDVAGMAKLWVKFIKMISKFKGKCSSYV